jgi:hypothetical protein
MGADMTLAIADVSLPKETWLQRVADVSRDELRSWFRDTHFVWRYYDNEGCWNGNEPTDALCDSLRSELRDAVEVAYAPPDDCTLVTVGGRRLIATGGLSCGYDPTVSFRGVELLCEFQDNVIAEDEVSA